LNILLRVDGEEEEGEDIVPTAVTAKEAALVCAIT
jgi:hypothetical protein